MNRFLDRGVCRTPGRCIRRRCKSHVQEQHSGSAAEKEGDATEVRNPHRI